MSNKYLRTCSIYNVASFLLIIFSVFQSTAQTWESSITSDYEIAIRDKWGELGSYEAKFIFSNDDIMLEKAIQVEGDDYGKVLFPNDFLVKRGIFDKDTLTNLSWHIEVKGKKVKEGNFLYDASPNTVLQLELFDINRVDNNFNVWGELIDSYRWIDKKGENVFIRSEKTFKTGKYIYAYHFIKSVNNYDLVRKITDKFASCEGNLQVEHNLPSLELTDVNKDTIGEISFMYKVDCKNENENTVTKLLFLDRGKKYTIRGHSLIYNEAEQNLYIGGDYIIGEELKKDDVIRRFMENKWIRDIKN